MWGWQDKAKAGEGHGAPERVTNREILCGLNGK